jgi:hypothetical protein
MQATLAFIHRQVFSGIDCTTSEAEHREHDYDDEYANFMDAFDRIALDDATDDGDMDHPQPPLTPSSQNNPRVPVGNHNRNATAGPSQPRARTQTPATVAELDMVQQPDTLVDNRNETGRPRPRARRQPPPATELVQDTAGELDGEDLIPRTTRQSKQGSGARGKGKKGKGKEKA